VRVSNNNHQALQMVFGVSGLAGAAFGVIGGLVGVVAVAPVLLPLLVLVIAPAWLAASKRGHAFWEFFWKMTPRDRQRYYLANVLRERDPAKEVRAFGLAGYLRSRYDRLYDERIRELRRISGKQVMVALTANLVIGAVLAATLLLMAWLTAAGDGRHPVGRRRRGRHRRHRDPARRRRLEHRRADRVGPLPGGLPRLHRDAAGAGGGAPAGCGPVGFHRLSVRDVAFTYPTATGPGAARCHARRRRRRGGGPGGRERLRQDDARQAAGRPLPARRRHDLVGRHRRVHSGPGRAAAQIAVIFQDFERFH
jgi:ATP-binding cassette subfamily B protein